MDEGTTDTQTCLQWIAEDDALYLSCRQSGFTQAHRRKSGMVILRPTIVQLSNGSAWWVRHFGQVIVPSSPRKLGVGYHWMKRMGLARSLVLMKGAEYSQSARGVNGEMNYRRQGSDSAPSSSRPRCALDQSCGARRVGNRARPTCLGGHAPVPWSLVVSGSVYRWEVGYGIGRSDC